MPLNWDDLKIILAVARAGSLSRAARLLEMDASTVSRRLHGVEAAIGFALFKRSKEGLEITDAGARLLPLAETVERDIVEFEEEAFSGQRDSPVGLIRLISNLWMLNRLSETVLPDFLNRYPDIELRLLGQVPRSPVRSDATLSLWFEAAPRHGDVLIRLGEVPFALYAAKGADAETLDWVSFFDEDAPDRAPVRYWNRHRRSGDRMRVTVTDAGLILAAVRSGVGKGLLPMCLAAHDPALQQIEGPEPRLTRTLHLHVHPDTQNTLRAKVTIEFLQEKFEEVFLPTR